MSERQKLTRLLGIDRFLSSVRSGVKMGKAAADIQDREGVGVKESIEIARQQRAEQIRRDLQLRQFIIETPTMGPGPMDELFVAVAHRGDEESVVLWTFLMRGSDGVEYPTMMPLVAKTEEDMERSIDLITASTDIYAMPGANEDISIRRYGSGEHVRWVRVGAEAR